MTSAALAARADVLDPERSRVMACRLATLSVRLTRRERPLFRPAAGDGSPARIDCDNRHRVRNARIERPRREVDARAKRKAPVSNHFLGEHASRAPVIDACRHPNGQSGIRDDVLRKQERHTVIASDIVTPEGEPAPAALDRSSESHEKEAHQQRCNRYRPPPHRETQLRITGRLDGIGVGRFEVGSLTRAARPPAPSRARAEGAPYRRRVTHEGVCVPRVACVVVVGALFRAGCASEDRETRLTRPGLITNRELVYEE